MHRNKMTPVSPRKGIYQIINAYTELNEDKQLRKVAEVLFKGENSKYFEDKIERIRISSLYNLSSIGPKHLTLEQLKLHIVHIQNLEILTNERHCVTWDVISSESYAALVIEENSIDGDLILEQETNNELNNSFLADEYMLDLHDDEMAKGLTAEVANEDEDSHLNEHEPF